MSTFAERGARVLYVDNLGTRMPRSRDVGRVLRRLRSWIHASSTRAIRIDASVIVDSPIVLPLQHRRLVRRLGATALTRRVRTRLGPQRPLIVWTYLPMPVVSDVAAALGADLLIYDWSDDASEHALTKSRRHRARIASWEDEMARRADIVFAPSAELVRRRRPSNPSTYVVPHGTTTRQSAVRPLLLEVARLPHPRVGFVGSITEWTDLELVDELARARPGWSFVMVGPTKVKVNRVGRRPNVVFTGARPHEEIPTLLTAFDAAIIPYRVAPAIEASSPLKLREYLAHGLPVVSVDIPEVRAFIPQVELASGPQEFLSALERALARGKGTPHSAAAPRSWDECADEITRRVDELLSDRTSSSRGTPSP